MKIKTLLFSFAMFLSFTVLAIDGEKKMDNSSKNKQQAITKPNIKKTQLAKKNKTFKNSMKQWATKRLIAKTAKKRNSAEVDKVLLVVLAIVIPPLAVYLVDNDLTTHVWLSILLWILGVLPGIIFALYKVLS